MAPNHYIVFLAVVLPAVALATDFIVGDDKGWTVNFDYQAWAKDKVFLVGDNLVFNYDPQKHNVFKANQTSFKDCILPPANQALTTGKDVIPLATPGKKWYICGAPAHCSDLNQKLAITVVSELGAPAPAPVSPSSAFGLFASTYQVVMVAVLAALVILV